MSKPLGSFHFQKQKAKSGKANATKIVKKKNNILGFDIMYLLIMIYILVHKAMPSALKGTTLDELVEFSKLVLAAALVYIFFCFH